MAELFYLRYARTYIHCVFFLKLLHEIDVIFALYGRHYELNILDPGT